MIARVCVAAVLIVGLGSVGDLHAGARARDRCAASSALPTSGVAFRAPATSGSVWALPFGDVPATTGDTLKVVWRVTGRGPLRVTFRDPSGGRHPLAFGPDAHSASTFVHPGREWGTGFAFDAPGCWTVRLSRAGTVATVGIPVN